MDRGKSVVIFMSFMYLIWSWSISIFPREENLFIFARWQEMEWWEKEAAKKVHFLVARPLRGGGGSRKGLPIRKKDFFESLKNAKKMWPLS